MFSTLYSEIPYSPLLRSNMIFSHEDFHLELLERSPQKPYPLHSHDFYELVIVTSGSGIHFTEHAEYEILPGDVFVLEAGYSHGYSKTSDLFLYNIIFDRALLDQTLFDLSKMPGYHAIFNIEPKYRQDHEFSSRLRLHPKELTQITERVQLLKRELDHRGEGYGARALALAYFIEIIVSLSRIYSQTNLPDSKVIHRLAAAFSYIENNSDRTIRIEELTDVTHMSHSTLNRAFKKAAGCSPVEYQLQLKVKKACSLLITTNLSITMIAERVGFSDSNYLSRQFKKIMHMSPREYRKAHTA